LAKTLISSRQSPRVIGCDLNTRMLAVARGRVRADQLPLVRCDAGSLPFASERFDAVTIGFAIDDMPERSRCAREMLRVLRPGGRLALLELSRPEREPFKSLYRTYLRVFSLLRRVRVAGYDYLAQEIVTYRGADAARELLLSVGFVDYQSIELTCGLARLHLARRARG
jgi:demethylmenaquinone methyltransferase/2-methoxy-6-polyprenyl-1,4-benzoquinol methylase